MIQLQLHAGEIRRVVDAACVQFSWYSDLVDASAYRASGDPQHLPFITEEILRENYYDSTAALSAGERVYFTSGTSSGRRKRILWSDQDHNAYVNQRTAILGDFISDDCRSACADLGTGHAASSALEIFERLGLKSSAIDFTLPVARHLEILNRDRPDVLFTMPMILDRILAAGDLLARPRKIIVVGDVAPEAWRQRIARRLTIKADSILDLYGSIEVGSIASFNHALGRYCFERHIIPEICRTRTGLSEETGEVLALTSLTRESFPAIRFVTGDVVEGFQTWKESAEIAYGFQSISGRVTDELKHGEKISVYSIVNAINSVLDAADFTIGRNDHGLIIGIASAKWDEAARDRIVELIRQANPDVDQMIRSGLVADIEVCRIGHEGLSAGAKRRIVTVGA